jgi:uncharacterized NAD(P)/FAD-binding protein YdhS
MERPSGDGPSGQAKIALIGAGATGTYCLHRIIELASVGKVTVFDANSVLGPGLPYAMEMNSPDALANIAGIEITPLLEPINAWATRLSAEDLVRLGIAEIAADPRAFFPRVAIGAWLADSFDRVVGLARANGIEIVLRRAVIVQDVVARANNCLVRWTDPSGSVMDERFDYVVVAIGYGAGADLDRLTGKAAGAVDVDRIGILGTSLSAIDAAVAIASDRGDFHPEDGKLRYRADAPWRATMMSRGGILPEADFWFPHPGPPPDLFTPEAVMALVDGRDGDLDAVFALFSRQLEAADSCYARMVDLAAADADTFADLHYFSARRTSDPFEHARANLEEALQTHAAQRVIPWRHAILRMHEVIALVVPKLSAADLERFQRGLKRVFADNYAAVPPLSIERLLALHEADVLTVQALGNDYRIGRSEAGEWAVTTGAGTACFDALVDARGQQSQALDRLPFPTLRMQLCSQAQAEGRDWEEGYVFEAGGAGSGRDTDLARVRICALPFLLRRQPFLQGLVECARLATEVAHGLGRDLTSAHALGARETLADAIREVRATTPVFLGDGTVITIAANPLDPGSPNSESPWPTPISCT